MISWYHDAAHFQHMIEKIEVFAKAHQGQTTTRQTTHGEWETVRWSVLCGYAIQIYKSWYLRALRRLRELFDDDEEDEAEDDEEQDQDDRGEQGP